MIEPLSKTAIFSLVKDKNNPRELLIFMQTGQSRPDHTTQIYYRLLLVLNKLRFFSFFILLLMSVYVLLSYTTHPKFLAWKKIDLEKLFMIYDWQVLAWLDTIW